MADQEGQRLRQEVLACARGRGKRYPGPLRRRLIAWAQKRYAEGEMLTAISKELGVARDTVRLWTARPAKASQAAALVPVEVIGESSPPSPSVVAVVSPSGFRLEGLTLEQAVTVLARLG